MEVECSDTEMIKRIQNGGRAPNRSPQIYHAVYARITGSVHAGVFLSYLISYWSSEQYWSRGLVTKLAATDALVMHHTGLTIKQIKTAKKLIKKCPFIKVTCDGVPRQTYYELDVPALDVLLCAPATQKGK